jgi:IS605 OrfB family transposase
VYNKTIEAINTGDKINFILLRDKLVTNETRKYNPLYNFYYEKIKDLEKLKQTEEVKALIKIEKSNMNKIIREKNQNIKDWELRTPKEVRAGVVNDICNAYKNGFDNLKKGIIKKFRLKFRKKSLDKKSFSIPKSAISNDSGVIKINYEVGNFIMGKRTIKKHKNLKIDHDCRIKYKKNKYWLLIPIENKCINTKKTLENYCGIDPGVRVMLTSFGNSGVVEYKHNKYLLDKLNKKLDKLKSLRRCRQKRKHLNKIEEKKENLIDEVHWKSINDILSKNDYIFFGDIKSHDIVKKSSNKYLNRNISDLKLYKFKKRLMFKASYLNKKVYSVNEAYTTKTCSCCGILNDVGKKEIYKCENCNNTLLRDCSAAKNILMKGIINYL